MLKQRLLTAAALIPLVIWALLALPSHIIELLFAGVAILAAWEWLHVMQVESPLHKTMIVLSTLVVGYLVSALVSTQLIVSLTVFIWLLATVIIFLYAHKPLPAIISKLVQNKLFSVPLAMVLLMGLVMSATWLHQSSEQGPLLLLSVLVIVWLADTGGYFAGKRYGKHKLATVISPNKTWEGVWGALFLSNVWAVIAFYSLHVVNFSLAVWLLLVSATVMISIVGDLFESVFKRSFHVKDSGNLLPGHGGILDRIDSLLSAIPFVTIVMMSLGAL